MKIAFLDPTAQAGGAERELLEVLSGLRVARPDWALHVTFGAEGPMVAKVRMLGVAASVLPFPPALARLGEARVNGNRHGIGGIGARLGLFARMLFATPGLAGYVFELRRALMRLGPDLVHSNGLKMDVLGMLARPANAPVLWHVHDHLSARPVMPHLMRMSSASCAGAIANSQSVARELRAACGERFKVFTVYNAVDLDRFSPLGPRLDLDALAGLPPASPGTLRVGLVATMARWKGHEVFLRALSLIPGEVPIRGYVIGGPIYQTDGSQYSLGELRAAAAALGVTQRLGFTGFVEDPAAAMRALDIVVHASTQPEPFGLVIAEGMACGKAVIVSEAGGAAEIVSIGDDVVSHPPGDAEALARCIEKFAADSDLRWRFGAMARAAAERRFARARLTDELLAIYRTVTHCAN